MAFEVLLSWEVVASNLDFDVDHLPSTDNPSSFHHSFCSSHLFHFDPYGWDQDEVEGILVPVALHELVHREVSLDGGRNDDFHTSFVKIQMELRG